MLKNIDVINAFTLLTLSLSFVCQARCDIEEDFGFCPISSSTCSLNSYPEDNTMATHRERTFLMVKPDAVQRGLIGDIIKRFEQKGFQLVAIKFQWAKEDVIREHYAEHRERPFFPKLLENISKGPVVPMVWEGFNIVKTARQMIGATNPSDSAPGTIRGDYCIESGRNAIHGSDSVESANREIALWFTSEELVSWKSNEEAWVYE